MGAPSVKKPVPPLPAPAASCEPALDKVGARAYNPTIEKWL